MRSAKKKRSASAHPVRQLRPFFLNHTMPTASQTLLGLIPTTLAFALFALICASIAKGAALLLFGARFGWKQAIAVGAISSAVGFVFLVVRFLAEPAGSGRWLVLVGHLVAVTLLGGWYSRSRGVLRSGEPAGLARGVVIVCVSHVFLFGMSMLAGLALSQWVRI